MKSEADIKIEELHQKVKEMVKKDMTEDDIINELKKDGIEPAYANLIIENVMSDKRDRIDFWKLILMGSFFIIGGVYINYFSYRIAVQSNSMFFYLFWGIIVTGIVILIRAFMLYRR